MRFLCTIGRAALAAASLCASTSVAFAQTQTSDAANVGEGAQAEQGNIVVTGSRILKNDHLAQSPIMTIGEAAISHSGQPALEASLNQLPQFQPSAGAAQAFPPKGGQANINLRGLGTNRALVLVDGRRIVPSIADGTVDVNLIPVQLIEAVDTITGGASTAYGSDAMAGVVNLRLRKNFSGLQVSAQSGLSDKGDAAAYDLALLAGVPFAEGRGHYSAFVGYTERRGATRGDRAFFRRNGSTNLAFLPQGVADLSGAPPSQAAIDTIFAKYGAAAGAVTGRAFGINSDNSLFTAVNNPVLNYRGGDPDVLIQNNSVVYNTGNPYSIQIPLKRVTTYGAIGYTVSDSAKLYAESLFSHYTAAVQYSVPTIGGTGQTTTVSANNPFIPADLKYLLDRRGTIDPLSGLGAGRNAPFIFRSSVPIFGPRQQTQNYSAYQLTAGIRGDLPGTQLSYDVYGAYGQVTNTETFRNGAALLRIQAMLASADGGASLCAGGLNPFGNAAISQSCIDYLRLTASNHLKLSQTVIEGTVQGPLFRLPAGDLRFAAGADYRRNTYKLDADPSLASGTVAGFGVFGGGGGNGAVKEVYGEVLVPLIHHTRFIRELSFDLAARYSDHDSVGGIGTYRSTINWTVAQPFRVRAGYSRAARAPSLGELYGAQTNASIQIGSAVVNGVAVAAGDPCDVRGAYRKNAGSNAAAIRALCIAQGVPAAAADTFVYANTTVFAINQGNPNLLAERADTYSLGGALTSSLRSPLLRNLSGSVDYYSIRINNAIGLLDLSTSLSRCFNAATNPGFSQSNLYCQQLIRKADGALANSAQPLLNQARFNTAGIDMQIDWRLNFGDFGGAADTTVGLNFAGTYVTRYQVQQIANGPLLDYAGTTGPVAGTPVFPKFKSITTASLQVGTVVLTGRWRHSSAVRDFSRVTNPASTIAGIPAYDYFDADIRFALRRGYVLQLGINNIADKEPPQVGTAFGTTDFATYDVIGRRLFLAVKATF